MKADPIAFVEGAKPHVYHVVTNDSAERVDGGVIDEGLLSIYVNGQDLATLMCSPVHLEALAVGFLYNERIIETYDEIGLVQCNTARSVVDVLLTHEMVRPGRRMILTAGCGGGITWQQLTTQQPPIESDFVTSPEVIFARMHELRGAARLYNLVRGVHTAVLGDDEHLLLSAEDVGRHNAVDKVAGLALMEGVVTRDLILLTSGRISSEMLDKARRMQCPIVVSRTAPTSITVQLAHAWNLCVVGYVRQGSMRVYTHPWRLGLSE